MCVFCTFPNKLGFFSYFFILVKEQANMEIFCRGPILRIFRECSDSDFFEKNSPKTEEGVWQSVCVFDNTFQHRPELFCSLVFCFSSHGIIFFS